MDSIYKHSWIEDMKTKDGDYFEVNTARCEIESNILNIILMIQEKHRIEFYVAEELVREMFMKIYRIDRIELKEVE